MSPFELYELFDEMHENVQRGREGLNAGIPYGTDLNKLSEYLNGVVKAQFALIGGNTGTGKTALVDQMFILGPIEFLELNPEFPYTIDYDYYTLEISTTRKLTKWACWILYKKYGFLVDSETMLSKKWKHRLSDETFQLFMETREWVENIQKYIHFKEHASPQVIYNDSVNYHSKMGTIEDASKTIKGITYNFKKYVPKDPGRIHMRIVDHIGLMRFNPSITSKKANLDEFSSNCVQQRNFYGDSTIAISQFNREIGDVNRQRFSELTPQLEDFKETGNTQEDADLVCALFEPKRYNIKIYKKVNLNLIDKYYRAFFVLKNREGSAGLFTSLKFLGECGYFGEFPRLSEFESNPNLYEEIAKEIKNVRRAT